MAITKRRGQPVETGMGHPGIFHAMVRRSALRQRRCFLAPRGWERADDHLFMNTPRVELLRLGMRLRNARAALGYNQRAFAAVCGLNRTYLGGVERGERNLTFSVLCALCAGLGCDVATLTAGIPDLSPPPSSLKTAAPEDWRDPSTGRNGLSEGR